MKIREVVTKPQGPLTPEQARIEALKAQARRSQDAVKAERARQKMQSAQASLARVNSGTNQNSKILEFQVLDESQRLQAFQAHVRLKGGSHSMATIELTAANIAQARAVLLHLFGKNNVVSVVRSV